MKILKKPSAPKRLKQLEIKTRIMLLYLLLSLVLLAVLISATLTIIAQSAYDSVMASTENYVVMLENALYVENDTVSLDLSRLNWNTDQSGIFLRVTDDCGNLIYQDSGSDRIFSMYTQDRDAAKEEGSEWATLNTTCTIEGHTVSIAAICDLYVQRFLNDYSWLALLIVPIYLLLAGIGSYLLARRALSPIAEITHAANEIKDGDWNRRISNVENHGEVGELAETFNEMLDELSESLRREQQFTSDASHELRTPVTVISACTDEALSTDDSAIIHENLTMIQNENKRMSRMISQLLTLSRGYEGRLHFAPESIALREMAESVAEVSSIEAEQRQITIYNEVPEEIKIFADQSLFTQVLMNLVGNAVKYGKQGGHVWISSEQDALRTSIMIRDDGIGISPEDLPYIFERFYRADTARNRSGSGLGLPIVKWIIEMHRGTIQAESVCGEGSVFTIILSEEVNQTGN